MSGYRKKRRGHRQIHRAKVKAITDYYDSLGVEYKILDNGDVVVSP